MSCGVVRLDFFPFFSPHYGIPSQGFCVSSLIFQKHRTQSCYCSTRHLLQEKNWQLLCTHKGISEKLFVIPKLDAARVT